MRRIFRLSAVCAGLRGNFHFHRVQAVFSGTQSDIEAKRLQTHQAIWKRFPQPGASTALAQPPTWFVDLCRDLHCRTGTDDSLDQIAREEGEERSDPQKAREGQEVVDPFLWLEFNVRREEEYEIESYDFSHQSVFPPEVANELCLKEPKREYICFCDAYRFPHRSQLPTSVGTQPARLLVDPLNPAPVVYVQLSPHFPPAMWLPAKATAASVRRIFAEFAARAAEHRDTHHPRYESNWEEAVGHLEMQNMPTDDASVLRYLGWMAHADPFDSHAIKEFHNYQELYLGEAEDPEKVMEHLELSPYLFAIPHFRTMVRLNNPEFVPRIDGPGVATSLFRCIYSKALMFVKVHLSTEVKLPPLEQEAFEFLWRDVNQDVPKAKVPIFCRVVWPDNRRMCGGGPLVARFNQLFGTEFANDMPVDACMALFHTMSWAGRPKDLLGIRGMRQRILELEAACQVPHDRLLYPGTADIPNPQYTPMERLAMHIQYAAHMNDPETEKIIRHFMRAPDASIRMGCAKAALESGNRSLFREIVSSEPKGRMQRYMTYLVRKRRTRDLTDKEPRLLDSQYEHAAPLWVTNRRLHPEDVASRAELERYKQERKAVLN